MSAEPRLRRSVADSPEATTAKQACEDVPVAVPYCLICRAKFHQWDSRT